MAQSAGVWVVLTAPGRKHEALALLGLQASSVCCMCLAGREKHHSQVAPSVGVEQSSISGHLCDWGVLTGYIPVLGNSDGTYHSRHYSKRFSRMNAFNPQSCPVK